ncbi:unnamed protein product [Adineta steineri]|uniref:cGMP-dependent protein kinase interacting domain-containing protein n=1 Tax=Adineta steineri TaxID=433720 RepID=A0A818V179_9BILA|nr:unnamed protein product [Adineta steineri]
MLSGINPSPSDEVNRQSSAIAKRREQLRRWDESETNRESSNVKISQRVKFQQAYVFLAACSSSDRDEVEKLLQRGVDINTSNIDGLTALHQACIDNNLLMVEYLLNRSADINCQDNEGWTPLHAASSCGNIDIVKYLLSRGATVDVCNNEGELPIDIAEGDDIIACLEEDMRRKGIDDEQARNIEHQLMLKHAQDWLNNNQKTNSKSLPETIVHARTGATALHVACAKGYLDVIDILLRAGANINSVDNDGWTPLHAAAHWDKHDIIKFLLERNADLDSKNFAGQTPLDVCDGVTYELLKELKEKRPPVKSPVNETPDNILAPWKRKPTSTRTVDEHKSILRTESHNENIETTNKTPPQSCLPSSSLPLSVNPTSVDENLPNCSPSIKEKLSSLQRSLHDLSNRYLKTNQEEPPNASTSNNNSTNNDLNKSNTSSYDQRTTKPSFDKLVSNSTTTSTTTTPTTTTSRPALLSTNKYSISNSQRTFTNPLQSLTANNNNINNDLSSRENSTGNIASSPTQSLDTKINRRWGTTDRTVGDGTLTTPNNTGPYVRRRSGAGVNEPTPIPTSTPTPTLTTPSVPVSVQASVPPPPPTTSTVVSVTTSLPSVTSTPTTNVTVTSSSNPLDDSTGGKRRSNVPPSRDEEAEAQRKHRSAQARRERRSTQSVTVEDIKAAEQQIKSQPNTTETSTSTITTVTIPQPVANIIETTSNVTLSNNKIGAPSTPSIVAEHDIETERLQRVIEEKKEKARRLSGNEDTIETTVDASSSCGSRRLRSRFTSADTDNIVPSITANDSLNLGVSGSLDSQQQQQQPRRRTNRVHNQRKNTGRIIWNDETKEVEIRDDTNDLVPKTSYQQASSEESHRSDDQKLQDNAQQHTTSNSGLLGSRGLISRFENTPSSALLTTKESLANLSPTSPPPTSTSSTTRNIRSQSQDPSRKTLTLTTSLPQSNPNTIMNGMATSTPFALKKDSKENTALSSTGISTTNNDTSAMKRLHDDSKRKMDELTQKVDRLERDIAERDQIIEKLKTSQYIESSLDKREKRAYERKISELEEELKKMDSIKADNTRLKEENAALIRVISKLSK